MALLMLGVAIGERSAAVVNGFCVIVLLLAGAALSSCAAGHACDVRRQLSSSTTSPAS